MVTRCKKYKEKATLLDKAQFSVDEAILKVKEVGYASFDETIELVVNLGIDTRKGDQQVRGSLTLPAGLGKEVRVAVIAKGDKAKEATDGGADLVGDDDLIKEIEAGNINFDILLTTPDMMPKVGKLGKHLGRRGLMPTAKAGTVVQNLGSAVGEFKKGKVEFKADKGGSIHMAIGKKSFTEAQLKENYASIYDAVEKAKPSSAKGVYFKSIFLSPTMGPGVKVIANS